MIGANGYAGKPVMRADHVLCVDCDRTVWGHQIKRKKVWCEYGWKSPNLGADAINAADKALNEYVAVEGISEQLVL